MPTIHNNTLRQSVH